MRKNPKGATIAFEAFRNDPAANPLDTPTGKIEIYSETLAGIAATWELGEEDLISPIPVYTHGFTDGGDELSAYAETVLSRHVTAFLTAVLPHGDARQEFSSLYRNSITLGLKFALP